MRFFTDTAEVAHVMRLLEEQIREGAKDNFFELIDKVMLALNEHVKATVDSDDYLLFTDCEDSSDILYIKDHFKQDGTKAAAEALGYIYRLRDGYVSGEGPGSLSATIHKLGRRLQIVLLQKFQPTIVANAIKGSRPKKSRKKRGISYFVDLYVQEFEGKISADSIWEKIEADEPKGELPITGEIVEIYVEGDRIYETLTNQERDSSQSEPIRKSSFQRYVTDSKKKFRKSKK